MTTATKTAPSKKITKKKTPLIEVDPDTKDMSVAALLCRGGGHCMVLQPLPAARKVELLTAGIVEEKRVCSGGCGRWRLQTFSLYNGRLLEDEGGYEDKTFLLPPRGKRQGSGRLSRDAARTARFARQYQNYL